jgi:hypothetical protein
MARHEAKTPGWCRRRRERKRAKAELTGDTPQKVAERARPREPISVQEAAERVGLRFGGGGGI